MERHILRKFYFPYAIDFIKRWKGVKNFGCSWDDLIEYLKKMGENSYRAELEKIKELMPENSLLHYEIENILEPHISKDSHINYSNLLLCILGFIVEVDQNLAKDRIRASLEIETELEHIKEDILQGRFLNDNYLAQFTPVASFSSLKKWVLYRANKTDAVDCDVSLAAIVTYCLMHDWLTHPTIQKQEGYARKYEIKNGSGTIYRGDTMTSAWTFFKKYLERLYKENNTSNEFKKFFTLSTKGYLAADDSRGLEKYFYDQIISSEAFLEIIEDTISNEARAFLDNYHKPGNMIICPTNFNKERAGYQARFDTVDRMLWAIYNYFQTNENQYLEELFKNVTGDALKTSIKYFEKWMDEANITTWSDFVEKNLLDDFVEDETKIPISMKTGKPIEDSEDYAPMPESKDEFEEFFSNLNQRIKARTKRIYTKIKEDYKLTNQSENHCE